MAIIKYQLDNGRIPSYITDGGYFLIGNYMIGIGSGGGTELSKSELLAYIMADHNSSTYQKVEGEVMGRQDRPIVMVDMSDSEVTAMVNDWCTWKGIS